METHIPLLPMSRTLPTVAIVKSVTDRSCNLICLSFRVLHPLKKMKEYIFRKSEIYQYVNILYINVHALNCNFNLQRASIDSPTHKLPPSKMYSHINY